MKPFFTTKRKLFELAFIAGLLPLIYFIWGNLSATMLFGLGYVWNWTASQDMSLIINHRRYRFSTLSLVFSLQNLVLIPFKALPRWTHILPKILPAGLLWLVIIFFVDSEMPWWATFLGSLSFELTQIDTYFVKESLS